MIVKIFFLLLISTLLYADSLDDDMDGIDNTQDQCPHSMMTDIVDETGCSVEKLAYAIEHHFDISVGFSYAKFDSNTSQRAQSLNFSYYYGENFSFSFYTSTYDINNGETGIDDSAFKLNYAQNYHDIHMVMEIGAYLPTFDIPDNKTDYFIGMKASKEFDIWDTSVQLQHTFMNDQNTQDTNLLSLSNGVVLFHELYTSLSYTIQDSIYQEEGNLQDITLFTSYFFDDSFFINSSFSLGLNQNAIDSASFSLGYSY